MKKTLTKIAFLTIALQSIGFANYLGDTTIQSTTNCSKNTMTHTEAIEYCNNSTYEGTNNWRLPTINETEANIENGVPSCDKKTWTSSKNGDMVYSWNNNQKHSELPTEMNKTRCVKDFAPTSKYISE
jgi:hypothetical protein